MSNVFNDQVLFNNGTQTFGNSSISGDLEVGGNIDGNVTGNVTGNLTGNVTGNVTGNLTGNVTGNVNALGVSTFTAGVNIGSGTSIFSPSSNILTLGINNSEKIRVTTTGIGIGTNFITRPFEVWAGTVAGTASTSFSVDGSGRVAMPYQPYIYGSPTNTSTGSGNFNSFFTYSSRELSFATDRITVPVPGVYLISFNTIMDNTATRKDSQIKVNGSTVAQALSEDSTTGYHYRGTSLAIRLQANDYIQFSADDWYSNATANDVWRTASIVLLG